MYLFVDIRAGYPAGQFSVATFHVELNKLPKDLAEVRDHEGDEAFAAVLKARLEQAIR